ncbi:hypothetical protein LIA77_03171 [Sarocladium implicatum]|nr:hypothetical protein LIA77_03171 [Sarocladium implicatum]
MSNKFFFLSFYWLVRQSGCIRAATGLSAMRYVRTDCHFYSTPSCASSPPSWIALPQAQPGLPTRITIAINFGLLSAARFLLFLHYMGPVWLWPAKSRHPIHKPAATETSSS